MSFSDNSEILDIDTGSGVVPVHRGVEHASVDIESKLFPSYAAKPPNTHLSVGSGTSLPSYWTCNSVSSISNASSSSPSPKPSGNKSSRKSIASPNRAGTSNSSRSILPGTQAPRRPRAPSPWTSSSRPRVLTPIAVSISWDG